MNAAGQALKLSCTLIALVCFCWYFVSANSPMIQFNEKANSQEANAIITNLTVSRFDETGNLVNYLQTPQMHYIPQEKTYFLKNPQIIVKQLEQPIWKISAEQAKAIDKGEKIIFIHQVVIYQAKGNNSQESTMKTEKLFYYPKKKFAMTNLSVFFEQPGIKIRSQGMKAYLADKHVQLSNTKAIYEPPEKKA
jgi:lipopolysaccharide export system protein LptC